MSFRASFPFLVLLLLIATFKFGICSVTPERELRELITTIKMWGEHMGKELRQLALDVTQRGKVEASFQNSRVITEDGYEITDEIAHKIRSMMRSKEESLKKIVEKAEFLAFNRKEDIFMNSTFDYYNAENITDIEVNDTLDELLYEDMKKRDEQFKCDERLLLNPEDEKSEESCKPIPYIEHEEGYYRRMPLLYHSQFRVPVNLNYSIVKVGTTLYYRIDEILNDVRWSEPLDLVFKKNMEKDPTLTWQYIAGTTGFLRHYPAVQWSEEQYDKTYEFRTRAWYLEAVSSPKNVVILLDMSGSMWQVKWKTAKLLVNNILDTLGDNDYVNVYVFNKKTIPLVQCFNFTLMQAHEENLRLIRESLDVHTPDATGNMTDAFNMAFGTLEKWRKDDTKMHCNQLIMFITDSFDYEYSPTELFKTYSRDESFFTPVRVFTFLMGTSESEGNQMLWIACANMGYYVNISQPSDIAERVLDYLDVLSRPLNLATDIKPNPIWTGTYADLSDRKLTNWLWNKHEGNIQRDTFISYSKQAYSEYNCKWDDVHEHFFLNTEHEYAKYLKPIKFNYMTTVSHPIHDRRPGHYQVIGVAGIDVPIEQLKTLTSPHRIGVNGYAFILTNNGLVVLHPNHRKEFENILKPTFNRVDMTEVEIIDDMNEARDFNESLLEVRRHIIDRKTGDAVFDIKISLDNMRRVVLSRRRYFYTPIEPFNLVVALPENYGPNRLQYDEDKVREVTRNKNILNALRKSDNWLIHPDWLYCKHFGSTRMDFETPEDELLYYLKLLERNRWKWFEHCNPELVTLLILDADATKWYENANISIYGQKTWEDFLLKHRVSVVFISTHSGLTRWKASGIDNNTEEDMIKFNSRSIDEFWYKRAVEFNYNNPDSFLYSVPFDTDSNSVPYVTASSTIFRVNKTRKAPVAVTGFKFDLTVLETMFEKTTRTCGKQKCPHTCDNIELQCFILDNNAYIVMSEEHEQVGKFFGYIRPDIMEHMVEDKIYKQTRFFDYQGICYLDVPKPPSKKRSSASRRFTIFENIWSIFKWLFTWATCLVRSIWGLPNKENPCLRAITSEYVKRAIRKTVPTPCDKERWLYTGSRTNYGNNNLNMFTTPECLWNYIVQPISHSNLMMVVVNAPCTSHTIISYPYAPDPVELKYNLSMPCYIALNNDYTRRPYIKCINKHEKENNLNLNTYYCGKTWD